jgi:hypothetical protein
MLYAAKCYWPGITPSEFERTAVLQLAEFQDGGDRTAQYLGSCQGRSKFDPVAPFEN